MENMREKAHALITLLRSNAPEEREQAAVLIYQEGMLMQKRIMQMGNPKATGPEKQSA